MPGTNCEQTTPTNFALTRAIGQFDPELGTLTSVEIQQDASITSDIRVENTSTSSDSTIDGTVSGRVTLTGPGGSNASLGEQTGTTPSSGTTMGFSFPGVSASDVTGVHVVISG